MPHAILELAPVYDKHRSNFVISAHMPVCDSQPSVSVSVPSSRRKHACLMFDGAWLFHHKHTTHMHLYKTHIHAATPETPPLVWSSQNQNTNTVHMHTYIHTYIHIRFTRHRPKIAEAESKTKSPELCTHLFSSIFACVCVCMCMCMCMCICMCMCMHARLHMHICVIYVCVHVPACVFISLRFCIHTHMHTYIHSYIHAYIQNTCGYDRHK